MCTAESIGHRLPDGDPVVHIHCRTVRKHSRCLGGVRQRFIEMPAPDIQIGQVAPCHREHHGIPCLFPKMKNLNPLFLRLAHVIHLHMYGSQPVQCIRLVLR